MLNDILMDLLIEHPYFGYLAGKVRFIPGHQVAQMQTVFNRGITILYNEDWFADLSYKRRKGALIHELMHLALLHFFRRDGREKILWSMACDIAVSELMDSDMVNDDVITTKVIYRETGRVLPLKENAETYFRLLSDDETTVPYTYDHKKKSIIFESGRTYNGEPLLASTDNPLMVQAVIDELTGIQIAAQGENILDESLGESTERIYKDLKLNWRHVLKRFLAGQGRIVTRRSYKRQSKRYDNLPGTKRSVGVRALVAVDESGSVSNKEVMDFHKELLRINGINHAQITAVRFDTSCSEPLPLDRFIGDLKRERRGGTDFNPVFELADQLKIPLVVLFTDGQGEAPMHVNQKVLWVLTQKGRVPVDYGTVVRFDV